MTLPNRETAPLVGLVAAWERVRRAEEELARARADFSLARERCLEVGLRVERSDGFPAMLGHPDDPPIPAPESFRA